MAQAMLRSDGGGKAKIPLPKGAGKTAQATSMVKQGSSNTNWKQPVQSPLDYNKGMPKGGYADVPQVNPNIYSQPVTESQINQGIGGMDALTGGGANLQDLIGGLFGGDVPLPGRNFTSEQTALNSMQQGGGRANLSPEDMFNTENIDYLLRNFMNMGGPGGRGNITWEDIVNYLPDNYAFLYPEYAAFMNQGGQVPLPGGGSNGWTGGYTPQDYSVPTWGGGGYGDKDYMRDSGLVNWRI